MIINAGKLFNVVLVELMLRGHVLRLLRHLVQEVPSLALSLGKCCVNVALVFHEEGKDHLGIDDISAIGFDWSHAPDKEKAFGEPVERHPAGDEIGEVLDDGEEGEDDPVGEPLRVVVLQRTLKSLYGAVGWVEESHKVGK